MKKFRVDIDMIWSVDYVVSAKTKAEAKRKAWKKFTNRVPKREFSINAEVE